jgi:hypothetical protein
MPLPLSQLDEIESIGFECEAGKLENSQAYRDVRDFAQTSLEHRLREAIEAAGKEKQFSNVLAVVFDGDGWDYDELTMGQVEEFLRFLGKVGCAENSQLFNWHQAKREAKNSGASK